MTENLRIALNYRGLKKLGLNEKEIRYFAQTIDDKPTLRLILKKLLIGKYRTILDIGCGVGHLEMNLSKNTSYAVIGLELNVKYLNVAKSLLPHRSTTDFILADSRFLPFRNRSFDAIVISDVLACMQLSSTLNEIIRTLSEGDVYFDLPNSTFYEIFPFLLPFPGFITYNMKEVKEVLRKKGLKVISQRVVALSEATRQKFNIPRKLNLFLAEFLKRLPSTIHHFLSKFWFLTIITCKKGKPSGYSL